MRKVNPNVLKNPIGRKTISVECFSGSLSVTFLFTSKEKADRFIAAAVNCCSIEWLVVYVDGKFFGGLDCEGS